MLPATADSPIQPQPRQLLQLLDHTTPEILRGGLKGIEKESLRVTRDGRIAHTAHPPALGSALTHPHITTDFSEALLEFITPPFAETTDALLFLEDIHRFVYEQLPDELLLAASIPCGIGGDENIPIAYYGTSNAGLLKHVYRRGLWHRYGRAMQTIAGIHFNYSVPESVWTALHEQEKSPLNREAFIADNYFGMIRNMQRCGWLILYLFGASPAVCKGFFISRPHLMEGFAAFDSQTLYLPYATSLRMSDIGYKNENQALLRIDHNSLAGYIDSLTRAITTPYPAYERIGVKVDGEYRQLSSTILQIENEFYSTIRPKQIAQSGEKPTRALRLRGVRYLELRSLDLDQCNPIGISTETARFIEALMLACLFQPSPPTTDMERRQINANQLTVARRGREPGLLLHAGETSVPLSDWGEQMCTAMEPICRALDNNDPQRPYQSALEHQRRLLHDPELTPSATILRSMGNLHQSSASLGLQLTKQHERYFRSTPLSSERSYLFQELARDSLARQQALEAADDLPFDQYLAEYLAQI